MTCAIPAGVGELRLLSRTAVPADLDPARTDRRRLGVALLGAWFDGEPVAAGHWLGGIHAQEADGTIWTDGEAVLRIPAGVRRLRLELGTWQAYWIKDGAASTPHGARRQDRA